MHREKVGLSGFLFSDEILIFIFGRFSETEAVAILTLIFSRYRVELKDEPQFAGESFDEKKKRILSSFIVITTT